MNGDQTKLSECIVSQMARAFFKVDFFIWVSLFDVVNSVLSMCVCGGGEAFIVLLNV